MTTSLVVSGVRTPSGACISWEDWWCGEASSPVCCVMDPPPLGTDAAIITIDATDGGVARLLVQLFDGPVPDPTMLVSQFRVTEVETGAMLVINSARETIHYYAADGSITDGSPLISPDEDRSMNWLTVGPNNGTRLVCVSVESPAGGGGAATVQIDTQLRMA